MRMHHSSSHSRWDCASYQFRWRFVISFEKRSRTTSLNDARIKAMTIGFNRSIDVFRRRALMASNVIKSIFHSIQLNYNSIIMNKTPSEMYSNEPFKGQKQFKIIKQTKSRIHFNNWMLNWCHKCLLFRITSNILLQSNNKNSFKKNSFEQKKNSLP